jgi:cytochrome c biogenesis protein CcmG/thiol:disulfide interchange protein DsbE
MISRWPYYAPLIILGILVSYFAAGLGYNPAEVKSVLINQRVPEFALLPIEGDVNGFSSSDLKGDVVLVNIFGSWCTACRIEHPFLMRLKETNTIPIYGINWREPDRTAGPKWLEKYGNPYTRIGDDPKSLGAIAFGVMGAPETFIIDKNGIIRFKHIGPITKMDWNRTFKPILEELENK